jgi:hypothetical protein
MPNPEMKTNLRNKKKLRFPQRKLLLLQSPLQFLALNPAILQLLPRPLGLVDKALPRKEGKINHQIVVTEIGLEIVATVPETKKETPRMQPMGQPIFLRISGKKLNRS